MPDTILLVDDDSEFRQEFTESLSDYTVLQAANGQEALRVLERPNEIDLVILDVMMPGASGTEVLKLIREKVPDMGIIILTGYSSKDVAVEALKGHADDYLEKPLDIGKTRETIETILASKRHLPKSRGQGVQDKIGQVKRFLERNCFKKVGLADVARAVYLSPKYLSRVFEEQTGVRFTQYRLRIKIVKAKEMLKKSALNVDQIADALGYKNTESFIRQFKKISGFTPTGFRKRISKKRKRR